MGYESLNALLYKNGEYSPMTFVNDNWTGKPLQKEQWGEI